ncbi:MAG: carbohydrate kinase family protein [Oscillospiraceae bacterium]|nr:carbohydrate kinase family protein [Oscillospiraceae bacterium]
MGREKGSYNVYIGDVALDEYYRADRWPGTADKEEVETLPAVPGGMIANAACVSAALGQDTLFWTAMNSGAISKLLLEDLEKQGIDTSMSVVDDSLPDSKTMIFLVENEHTIFIPILHIEKIELTEEQVEVLKNARYIYSTCGVLATLRFGDKIWQEFAPEIRAAGAKVVVDYDVDYERNGDEVRFMNVDIGFFNETGFDSVRGERSFQEEAARLHELGMDLVVVTLGADGCVVDKAGEIPFHVPARNVEVVDVTGAGDTFCSSFIAALEENGLKEAAEFATAAASICVSHMGARSGAVSKEEVLKVLNG